MKLEEALRAAATAVDAADVPAEFRKEAFSGVLRFLLGSSEPVSDTARPESRGGGVGGRSPASASLEQLAAKLKLAVDLAEQAFYLENDTLELTVPSGKIATSKNAGGRQISLLVAAGRQATGIDQEWTHSAILREACNRFGRYDINNFGSTLSGMDDVFHIRGRQQDKEVRVLISGFEKAGDIVRSLLGAE